MSKERYPGANLTLEARASKYFTRGSLEECWRWRGHKDRKGYGRIRIGGAGSQTVQAHRVVRWYWLGPFDLSKHLDHTCEHEWCVNPWHTQEVDIILNNWYRDNGHNGNGHGPVPAYIADADELNKLLERET